MRPRLLLPILLAALVASGLSACLAAPASTSKIVLLGSRTIGGWRFDQYRNEAYPCSISGSQTFVVGRKVGSSDTATRPLWVKLRGGGAGWFAPDGTPQPSAGVKTEESFDEQLKFDTAGLMADIKAAPEGFRILIVSMCSHDVYAGNNTADPNNPNTTPDGKARPTTGLPATKAAIQFTTGRYPTDDFVLHGTSAGGAGALHVGYALQQQGLVPTAIVSDSGVVNQAWEQYVAETGISGSTGCEKATDDRGAGVLGRIDPELANPDDQIDRLIRRGAFTVPVLHIWNRNDNNSCGDVPIPCPLPDGSTVTMGASECRHAPLRLAIESLGAGSTSKDVEVCVEGGDTSMPCDRHVVTAGRFQNTDTSGGIPADYTSLVRSWVRARLGDD